MSVLQDGHRGLDRLVHNAHRIDLNGESLRRTRNPAERPEPVVLWTCRCAWTTRTALPTCPQQEQQKTIPSSRDSRLTTRLRRCQKPHSQNASRPGRHHPGTVGEIISESWARSNRYTRATSSESARSKSLTQKEMLGFRITGFAPGDRHDVGRTVA